MENTLFSNGALLVITIFVHAFTIGLLHRLSLRKKVSVTILRMAVLASIAANAFWGIIAIENMVELLGENKSVALSIPVLFLYIILTFGEWPKIASLFGNKTEG